MFQKIIRISKMPLNILFTRLFKIFLSQFERISLPYRSKLSLQKLLSELNADNLDILWNRLSLNKYPSWFGSFDKSELNELLGKNELDKIFLKAEQALENKINILGSGLVHLGEVVNWHKDFKTNFEWKPKFFCDIEYNNLDKNSDVKIPWELSRLQWLIPVGQAFILTKDERYATKVKETLTHWIKNNPYGYSVNWSCTMEVAMRIFTMTWLFHAFKNSKSWNDPQFKINLLRSIYLHVEFTYNHLEISSVNGNHYTADISSLVIGGLFFDGGKKPEIWHKKGWKELSKEILLQTSPDGINFEGSLAYHRLVAELFLWPAIFREKHNLIVEKHYKKLLLSMAKFSKAYSRIDGSTPNLGDADDARTNPFGSQNIDDHSYLFTAIGIFLNDSSLLTDYSLYNLSEIFWLFGPEKFKTCTFRDHNIKSSKFDHGGYFILRSKNDHVFIDCSSVGFAGLGGHGHNDCLSFEAFMSGEKLITDCGAYTYTASYKDRNLFRSSSYHNTPNVNNKELNRFINDKSLWQLHNDAKPKNLFWLDNVNYTLFWGEHNGYERLNNPLLIRRAWLLDKLNHSLLIYDLFIGQGKFDIDIPLHFSPDTKVTKESGNKITLSKKQKNFFCTYHGDEFSPNITKSRFSPSYGVAIDINRICWSGKVNAPSNFITYIGLSNSTKSIIDMKQQLFSISPKNLF